MKRSKKEKKSKTQRMKKETSESSSDEGGDEQVWVEVTAPSEENHGTSAFVTSEAIVPSNSDKVDDQLSDFLSDLPTFSSASLKEEKEGVRKTEEKCQEMEKNVRELNPYWKNGGTGLPTAATTTSRVVPVTGCNTGSSSDRARSKVISDSGAGWLNKAYERLVERANSEGTSLEELAAERWGSLARLQALIDLAEEPTSTAENTLTQHYRSKTNRSRFNREGRSHFREDRSHSKDDRSHSREDRSHLRDDMSHSREDRSHSREDRPHSREDGSNSREDRSHSREDRSHSKDDRSHSREDGSHSREDRSHSRADRSYQETRPRGRDRFVGRMGGRKLMKPCDEDDLVENYRTQVDPRNKRDPGGNRGEQRNQSSSWRKKEFLSPGTEDENDSSNCDNDLRKTDVLSKLSHADTSEGVLNEKFQSHKSKMIVEEITPTPALKDETTNRKSPSIESVRKSDETKEPDSKSPKILSREELNRLAARLMKAEMLGNKELALKLQKKLTDARESQMRSDEEHGRPSSIFNPLSHHPPPPIRSKEDKVVVLTVTGKDGTEYPLELNSSDEDQLQSGKSKRKKQKMVTHDSEGNRVRYFTDDDKQNLQSLVREERRTTAAQQNLQISKFLATSGKSSMESLDDIFVSSASTKMSGSKSQEKMKQQAMKESLQKTMTLEKCQFCFDNKEIKKHLVIAVGTNCYLSLPCHESLILGHCYIVPMYHVSAGNMLDEDVWAEMTKFKQSLVKMFQSLDKDIVFMETALHRSHHMKLKCIPLPMDEGSLAPMYYKKAIMESETEWSQNKKLIDLKNRDVRSAVPKSLPYFSVDFGLTSGYAHVIEDMDYFPAFFGEEIAGGLLDVEPRLWRHPPMQTFSEQNCKVIQFANWYKPYDWTADITT